MCLVFEKKRENLRKNFYCLTLKPVTLLNFDIEQGWKRDLWNPEPNRKVWKRDPWNSEPTRNVKKWDHEHF